MVAAFCTFLHVSVIRRRTCHDGVEVVRRKVLPGGEAAGGEVFIVRGDLHGGGPTGTRGDHLERVGRGADDGAAERAVGAGLAADGGALAPVSALAVAGGAGAVIAGDGVGAGAVAIRLARAGAGAATRLAEADARRGIDRLGTAAAPRVKPAGDVPRHDLFERGQRLVVEQRGRVRGEQRHLARVGGGARDVDSALGAVGLLRVL